MENAATPTGADASIEDRIGALLSAENAPAPEPEATPEPEPEVDASPEASGEEAAEVTEDAPSEGAELSLDDLSSYLGVDTDRLDVDEDGKIYVKTKVDGQEGKATLADLVKSYQLEGHLNKRNMEVAERQKALEQKLAEADQKTQTKLQELEDLTQLAWNQLTQEYQSTDWNSLRQQDPAEYAARSQDFQRRQAELQQAYQQIQGQRQLTTQQQMQSLREHLAQEDQKLVTAIDGWSDQSKARKELGDIYSYLGNTYGFQNEQLYGVRDQAGNLVQPGIADHRFVVIARKAMLYDQMQQKKPAVDKKVKTLPKVVKPGTAKSKAEMQSDRLAEQRKRLKQTGDVKDAALLIRNLL